MLTKRIINDLTYKVNACIIEVHKILGPGLLESVYHKCLKLKEIDYETERYIPIKYKDLDLTTDFRCDFLVEGCIIIELKAVQEIVSFFKAKLINHMKLSETPKGILVKFNVLNIMKEGHHTFINDFYDMLPD